MNTESTRLGSIAQLQHIFPDGEEVSDSVEASEFAAAVMLTLSRERYAVLPAASSEGVIEIHEVECDVAEKFVWLVFQDDEVFRHDGDAFVGVIHRSTQVHFDLDLFS